MILRYDGAQWSLVYRGDRSAEGLIWAAAADDVWVPGLKFPSTPTLYRFDGTALVERPGQPAFTRKFVAIGGTARDDVWILDNGGGLYHYDGAGYATMTVPGTESIDSIYARSRTEVYFLRRFPTGLLLYDGRAFTEIARPSGDFLISLQDVAGAPDGPVLIGGTGEAVLRLR